MKTIQIQNGKATYEGLEIENFAECQPLDGIHFKDEQYPLKWNYKDGNYPLPEGWDVVKYKNLNEFGLFITARLIRKEQNQIENCPTLFPCDCEDECAVLKSQNSERAVELSDKTQPSAPTKEELRKEFDSSEPDWEAISKMPKPADNKCAHAGCWSEGEMVGYAKCMITKVKPLESRIFHLNRLRIEDVASSINEENELRAKLLERDQEIERLKKGWSEEVFNVGEKMREIERLKAKMK